MDHIRNALSSLVAFLLIGVITVFISVGSFIIVPFIMITQWLFNWPYKAPDQDVVDEFQRVYEAMGNGDIAFLESYAKTNLDFPKGVDGFIGRHWLTDAIDSGSLATVRWILDQGVEVNYFDDEGYSPLMSAIEDRAGETTEILKMLLDAGADARACGTLDVTALHHAVFRASPEAIRMLLEHGADPMAYDSDYVPETPIDNARHAKRPEIVALLESYSK